MGILVAKLKTLWSAPLVLLCFSIDISIAHADVFKCVVNGKVTYTDTACSVQSKPLKINPKANSYTGSDPLPMSYQTASDDSKKCNELLEDLRITVPDSSRDSIGEIIAMKHRRNAIREEYELRCMTADERASSSQKRMESQLKDIRRQQAKIRDAQQQIQNEQRKNKSLVGLDKPNRSSIIDSRLDSPLGGSKPIEMRNGYDYDPINKYRGEVERDGTVRMKNYNGDVMRGNIDDHGYGNLRDEDGNTYRVRPK